MTLLVFTPGSFREAAVQILWEQPSEEIQAFVHEPGAFKFLTTIEYESFLSDPTSPSRAIILSVSKLLSSLVEIYLPGSSMPHVFDWDKDKPSPTTTCLFWRNHNQRGLLDE